MAMKSTSWCSAARNQFGGDDGERDVAWCAGWQWRSVVGLDKSPPEDFAPTDNGVGRVGEDDAASCPGRCRGFKVSVHISGFLTRAEDEIATPQRCRGPGPDVVHGPNSFVGMVVAVPVDERVTSFGECGCQLDGGAPTCVPHERVERVDVDHGDALVSEAFVHRCYSVALQHVAVAEIQAASPCGEVVDAHRVDAAEDILTVAPQQRHRLQD